MVFSVLVGGRHIPLKEVTLVTTSTPSRPYAQVVLDGAALEVIQKNTASAKKAEKVSVTLNSSEGIIKLSLSQVRAAILARIVHAMQGRSGLRPAIVQLLTDLLNADIQSFTLPANDTQIGETFIGFFTGSDIQAELASELTAKNIALPKFELSDEEVASFRQNSSTLALVGSASLFFSSCAAATGSVDAVAALTCAAVGVPGELKDDSGLEFRPHRSIATAAGNIKAFLRESPDLSAPHAYSSDLIDIPQLHGPAVECLSTAVKAMATELNSFEKGGGASLPLGPGPTLTSLRSALHAVIALEQASRKRLSMTRKGIRPWSPPAINAFSLSNWELMSTCLREVTSLQHALIAETDSAMASIQTAMHEASKKAVEAAAASGGGDKDNSEVSPEVKAKMEEVAEKERQLKAKMSPEELAKYEKKKAEKEAKLAAKAAAKKDKAGGGKGGGGGGGKGGLKSIGFKLSPGIEAVVNMFKGDKVSTIEQRLDFSNGDFSSEIEALLEALSSGGKNRTPKIARGTRDFGPQQMKVRSGAFASIRSVFDKHGAVEIDTPVFELKETLTGKYGEDSKLIYDLADQGGELLALRYDLTVPFARFLAMHSVGNIKRFHIAKVYRRDNPQLARGRYREFYQCDFDIAGTYLPMVADAEVVTLAAEILASLDIGSFVIKLNHRVILDAIFEICGVPSDKFRAICSAVDKLDKSPWSEVRREMTEDKGLSEEAADKIGTFVQRNGSPREMHAQLLKDKCFGNHKAANDALEELTKLWDYLEAMGSLKYVSFDFSLARGLDYYTGLIYECVHTEEGGPGVGSIAAGGRYDNLVGMFSQDSNAQVPCVGVSIGVERIFAILEAKQKSTSAGNVTCFVASVGKGMLIERMRAAHALWEGNVSAEFWQNKENPRFAGPGSQLDYVLKSKIPFMVIVGEEEAKKGLVKVKHLTYSEGEGEEDPGVEVPLSEVAQFVQNLNNPTTTFSSNNISSSASISVGSSLVTGSAQKSVCCVPDVKLSATSKFAVLDLTSVSNVSKPVLAISSNTPAKKTETAAKKAPAPAAVEDEDEIDLGFDDEEEEDSGSKAPSRAEQAAALKKQRDEELEEKKAAAMARLAKKEANQRSLCNLEIKPWEAEQDLMELFAKIKREVVKDGLKWSENCALVDVAYGIKKIVLTAVISLNLSMDAIIEEMTEETFVDEIQSMTMTSMSLL